MTEGELHRLEMVLLDMAAPLHEIPDGEILSANQIRALVAQAALESLRSGQEELCGCLYQAAACIGDKGRMRVLRSAMLYASREIARDEKHITVQ